MSSQRQPLSLILWAVFACLAIGLFAVLSWLAIAGSGALASLLPPYGQIATPVASPGTVTAAEAVAETPQAPSGEPVSRAEALALWLSAVSAITGLIGLVSTVLINWRKEQREAIQAHVELEKTRLEMEKLRLETERLRELSEQNGQ